MKQLDPAFLVDRDLRSGEAKVFGKGQLAHPRPCRRKEGVCQGRGGGGGGDLANAPDLLVARVDSHLDGGCLPYLEQRVSIKIRLLDCTVGDCDLTKDCRAQPEEEGTLHLSLDVPSVERDADVHRRVGFVAGLLIAVSLWPVMQSRWGLRAVSLTFFTALTIFLYFLALRRSGKAIGLSPFPVSPPWAQREAAKPPTGRTRAYVKAGPTPESARVWFDGAGYTDGRPLVQGLADRP